METRQWDELNTDCLLNVLGRVGISSLTLDIPFVCKSWYETSLDPQCWKILDFTLLDSNPPAPPFAETYSNRYGIRNFSDFKFIKFVVQRSCRSATTLRLPFDYSAEILDYIAEECPAVTFLRAGEQEGYLIDCLAEFVGKMEVLECMQLDRFNMEFGIILWEIGISCHTCTKFITSGVITKIEANHIACCIPNLKLKFLGLQGAILERDALLLILEECKQLEGLELDISWGMGVDIDEEILEKASHLKCFHYKGCNSETLPERVWRLWN